MRTTSVPTTNVDGFAHAIYEQCDNLERYGYAEEAHRIRNIVSSKVVTWRPETPPDIEQARRNRGATAGETPH